MRLDATEHFAWLTLRRVKAGGIARSADAYVEYGRPLGLLFVEVLAVLAEQGEVQTGDPALQDGLAPVRLTDAGAARYSALCKKQRAALPVPPPEHDRRDS